MVMQRDIYVYMDWPEDAEPVCMGVLHSKTIWGKEAFLYENDPAWLAHPRFRALDPDLSAFTGKQCQPSDKSNFGLFIDSDRTVGNVRLCAGGKPSMPGCRTENRERNGLPDGRVRRKPLGMGKRFKFSKEGDFTDNDRLLSTPP